MTFDYIAGWQAAIEAAASLADEDAKLAETTAEQLALRHIATRIRNRAHDVDVQKPQSLMDYMAERS